jgi:hypothetical protein
MLASGTTRDQQGRFSASVFSPSKEYVQKITADWEAIGKGDLDADRMIPLLEPYWNLFFSGPDGKGAAMRTVDLVDKIRLQGKLITRANATRTGMLSLEDVIEWYRVTLDVWPSIKDNIGEEKKPPANFELTWDNTILSAKVAFDALDTGDRGMLEPECMLEVAQQVLAETKISVVEKVKLQEDLLNYRQRINQGLMSFQDLAAWQSRIPQTLAGIRSLGQKQTAARYQAQNGAHNGDMLLMMISSITDTLGGKSTPRTGSSDTSGGKTPRTGSPATKVPAAQVTPSMAQDVEQAAFYLVNAAASAVRGVSSVSASPQGGQPRSPQGGQQPPSPQGGHQPSLAPTINTVSDSPAPKVPSPRVTSAPPYVKSPNPNISQPSPQQAIFWPNLPLDSCIAQKLPSMESPATSPEQRPTPTISTPTTRTDTRTHTQSTSAQSPIFAHSSEHALASSKANPTPHEPRNELHNQKTSIVEMILRLDLDFQAALGQEGSMQRQFFIQDLKQDLADASGMTTSDFNILKLSPGSVVVDLNAPEKAAQEIQRQSLDPNSRLRSGKVTRFTDKITLPSEEMNGAWKDAACTRSAPSAQQPMQDSQSMGALYMSPVFSPSPILSPWSGNQGFQTVEMMTSPQYSTQQYSTAQSHQHLHQEQETPRAEKFTNASPKLQASSTTEQPMLQQQQHGAQPPRSPRILCPVPVLLPDPQFESDWSGRYPSPQILRPNSPQTFYQGLPQPVPIQPVYHMWHPQAPRQQSIAQAPPQQSAPQATGPPKLIEKASNTEQNKKSTTQKQNAEPWVAPPPQQSATPRAVMPHPQPPPPLQNGTPRRAGTPQPHPTPLMINVTPQRAVTPQPQRPPLHTSTPKHAASPQPLKFPWILGKNDSSAPHRADSSTPQRAASPQLLHNSQQQSGNTDAATGGVGITFGRTDPRNQKSALFILALNPNGPAARTGRLEPMQELISIDGWPVFGQDIPAVSQRVKGKAGTSVTLEVFASFETCQIPIPRSLHRKITWQRPFLRSLV